MHQVSADSPFVDIMPRNGPTNIFSGAKCEMTHYSKICDKSTHFAQNECPELVHGPFNVQISANIGFSAPTTENKQACSRFFESPTGTPSGRSWPTLFQKIKDSSKQKRIFETRKYCCEIICSLLRIYTMEKTL